MTSTTDGAASGPNLNRAGRRAETRRLRKAGAALATVPAALGTTALLLGATTTAVGAATTWTVNTLNDDPADGCTTDPNGCTLRDALADAADGDTIVFQAGLTGDIDLDTELTVDASVTIQGPGAGVIAVDGQDTVRIFNISTEGGATGNVTISGLTLKDGSASGGGAILNANENIVIDGVTFESNESSDDGGAIHSGDTNVRDNDLTIRNSAFTGNTAVDYGGAIRFNDGALAITDTTFTENSASNNAGGAIYAGKLEGPVTIAGSTFTRNSGESGGAVAIWYSDDADVRIENSQFDDNEADDDGGALYLYELGTVTIVGTSITNNTAVAGGGGAKIYDVAGDLIIDSTVVAGNTSTDGYGGGLYVSYVDGESTISFTTVADNTAGDSGGGIEWYCNDGLTLRNSTLSGNTAGDWGGGIYVSDCNYETSIGILNSTISGNTAGEEGGGISFASYYGLDIVQSTITANTATSVGGVFIDDDEDQSVGSAKADTTGTETAGGKGEPRAPRVQEDRVRATAFASVFVVGSIVSGNSGADIGDSGTVEPSNSILGTISGTTVVDGGGNLQGVNPLLGPLQDNGGPTQTHALLEGSPAINAGPDPLTPFPGSEDDQRGPGYARVVGGRVDIGAFEVQPTNIEPTFTG